MPGYSLLRLIRSFVEANMYMSFELQSSTLIKEGQHALTRFGALLKVSVSVLSPFD